MPWLHAPPDAEHRAELVRAAKVPKGKADPHAHCIEAREAITRQADGLAVQLTRKEREAAETISKLQNEKRADAARHNALVETIDRAKAILSSYDGGSPSYNRPAEDVEVMARSTVHRWHRAQAEISRLNDEILWLRSIVAGKVQEPKP